MIGHLVFGDYDFGELFFCHAQKRIMPESDVVETAIGGRDGAYHRTRKFLPIEIECVLVLRGSKQGHGRMVEILDEVASHLKEPQQRLYLPTDDERYYIATVTGMGTVEEFVTSARLTVTFRAADPFRYGVEHTFPLPAGTSTAVRAGGNREAFPKFTATATAGATYCRMRNTTTNTDVYLYPNKVDTSDGWTGGESIVVDMERELATVNGQVWPVSLTSDFFAIEGEQKLFCNFAATVEWSERWL